MSLFPKKDADQHAGSGLDKADPKSLLAKVTDALKPKPATKPADATDASKDGEVVTPPVIAPGSD